MARWTNAAVFNRALLIDGVGSYRASGRGRSRATRQRSNRGAIIAAAIISTIPGRLIPLTVFHVAAGWKVR